jgi:transposase-like protein
MVGLVEAYSNKSADAARLWKLAVLAGERTVVERVVPRQARRLTPAEVAEFCEAYCHGGNVREWARKFDVHRSTLHEIVRRRGLERLPGIVTPE